MPAVFEDQLSDLERWLSRREYWCVTGRYGDSMDRFPVAFSDCPKDVWIKARIHRREARLYGRHEDGQRRKIYAMRLETFMDGRWVAW